VVPAKARRHGQLVRLFIETRLADYPALTMQRSRRTGVFSSKGVTTMNVAFLARVLSLGFIVSWIVFFKFFPE
jgi:hypothetical protein